MATQNPQQQQPQYTCRKCGHREAAVQLRQVVVTVGWAHSKIVTIAPCQMCTKCGNRTVVVDADIGDLAGLVPEQHPDAVKPPPASAAECEARIDELRTLQTALFKEEKAAKAAAAKGKRGGKKKATKKKATKKAKPRLAKP